MGVRMGSGHVVIQGRGFQEEQTIDYRVEDPEEVIAIAEAIPGVEHAVPRVRANGLISSGASSAPIIISGVDPTLEPEVSDLASEKKRAAGSYLRPRSAIGFENEPGDIYLGKKLMETLELEVGDRVVVTASPLDASMPASAAFVLCGVFETGIDDLDGYLVQIALPDAKKLLHLGSSVTQVAVLIDDIEDAHRVAAALTRKLGADELELEILPWQEALRELYEAILLDDMGMYLMMAIIFVIVAIGIFNTVLMSVVERTREFGVMLAVGTSKRRLFSMVFTEAIILALVSAVVGVGIGLGIHAWVASSGIDMAAIMGEDYEMAGVVFEGKIYSSLSAGVVSMWTVVVIGIVLVSAIYPAFRVTKLQPVEAMRHA
jgi:ABC-type lipoprotein release transport system permease subunit